MDYARRDESLFNARAGRVSGKLGRAAFLPPIVHMHVCARLHAPIHNVNQTYTDHGVKSTMQQTFYLQLLCLSPPGGLPSPLLTLPPSVDSSPSLMPRSLWVRARRGQRDKLAQIIEIFYTREETL